jgi:uncharacterized OB-fold protein
MTATAVEDWLLDSTLAPTADDDLLAPLYRAAARDVLAMPFCAACALALELDQEVCDSCGHSERNWRAVDPSGTVHATTLMHRREPGLVHGKTPYPIVDVELSSGHRMVMTTVRPTDTAPLIGAAVRIGFRHLGSVAIPAINFLEDQ